ncbi:MAG: DUF167 domain-containing protein [Syntrophomonadaceae bacterium]|nr:DUF167 domain-containing protein [Syntrophomonadaceae bacterium]MDH7497026.1 DUF167 domain-containing protein [Syntrophomonadaceae bacterium]
MIEEVAGGIRLRVQVVPRASRNEIVGMVGEALKVRLTAPPVEGEANRALVALLARTAGVAARDVMVVAGAGSRRKVIEVRGVSADEFRRRTGLRE